MGLDLLLQSFLVGRDRRSGRESDRAPTMLQLLGIWMVVGLSTGCLARVLVSGGETGVTRDLALGVAGSTVLNVFFLGLWPHAGGVAVVAFIGAGASILAQRLFWRTVWVRG